MTVTANSGNTRAGNGIFNTDNNIDKTTGDITIPGHEPYARDFIALVRRHGCPLLLVHGNNDTTGALRAIEMVTTGLQWRLAQAPVTVVGEPTRGDLDACWELGAAVAAGLVAE